MNRVVWIAGMLWITAGTAHAQNGAFFDSLEVRRFFLYISGQFNARSAWNVNLLNAPTLDLLQKPPNLDVSKQTLDYLNKIVEPAFFGLLDSLGFRVSLKLADYDQWRKLAGTIDDGNGDRFYYVNLLIDGDNGLGGNYGGLDLRLKFTSLHRNPKLVYGFAKEEVAPGRSEQETWANLRQALLIVLREAIADWKQSLKEEKKWPRRSFDLILHTEKLDKDQRSFVKEQLVRCVNEQVDNFDYMIPDFVNDKVTVNYRLRAHDEPIEFLRRYKETFLMSAGTHGKYPCSLWKTPLERYRPLLDIDSTVQQISITWVPSE